MADPENHTLQLLREMRQEAKEHLKETLTLKTEIRNGFDNMDQRFKNLQQAMMGESVLGRYTVAEVEERLEKIEQRLATLERSADR